MVTNHIGKIPVRKADSHKGDFGKVCVIAGSGGMTGAAYLCSQAAMRSGSGLVTTAIPASLNYILAAKLTEVMTLPLSENRAQALSAKAKKPLLSFIDKCDVVAMGPGLGQHLDTPVLVRELVLHINKPLVLDADGINALKGNTRYLKKRKNKTVITPHAGEMAGLLKKDVKFVQSQRSEIAKIVAKDTGAVVCLKGHRTVVASPSGDIYVNETGNSGMSTGGAGDLLTGMIASFIGQGVDEYSAVISAVYLHGLAGDLAAEKIGPFSMIATDILNYLPQAFQRAGLF
ncbi:MAG TPA: NAD(P)H-hydrate dehydratase [Candidatus Omnitrophota bacterium]|nr:NAD(P)H-hydrate dehydratase [Candidatus Omnitrophota bacterium]HPS21131.1 NAD(P)H-hydrate dehydratase [Candidatus Omnitrophota bacterium]